MTAFWGYLLEAIVRRLPLAAISIILFITIAICAIWLVMFAARVILDV